MTTNKAVQVCSPVDGEVMTMDKVPDAVFSQKMMGDGFAVAPTNGRIGAPIKGEVMVVAETGHAYGLKGKNGVEILVHFGLDTVKLKGEGICVKVKVGDWVEVGDVLCEVAIERISAKVPSLITPVVVTSGHEVTIEKLGIVTAEEKVMSVG